MEQLPFAGRRGVDPRSSVLETNVVAGRLPRCQPFSFRVAHGARYRARTPHREALAVCGEHEDRTHHGRFAGPTSALAGSPGVGFSWPIFTCRACVRPSSGWGESNTQSSAPKADASPLGYARLMGRPAGLGPAWTPIHSRRARLFALGRHGVPSPRLERELLGSEPSGLPLADKGVDPVGAAPTASRLSSRRSTNRELRICASCEMTGSNRRWRGV